MYKIAICDNETSQVNSLESRLSKYFNDADIQCEIDSYDNGERLIQSVLNQSTEYQIIFLDIEMQELNGIEIARILRKVDKDFILIYVTSYEQYTLESFEVSPFRYLIKPVADKKLQEVLKSALVELATRKNYLFYNVGSRHFQIRTDEILMLCSEFGRKIHVELNNKEDISFYGKISLIDEQLPDSSFVKVNSGTIVNMHYIATFSQNVITLINGENVSISRSRRKTVRFLYNQFIERNFGI